MKPRGIIISLLTVLAVLVLLLIILLALPNSSPTGETVAAPSSEQSAEQASQPAKDSDITVTNIICSGTECNTINSQLICSNGQWVSCPADQICALGACVTPKKIQPSSPFVSGGGSSGSESSGSSPSSSSGETETIRSIGIIEGSSTENFVVGETVTFSVSGVSERLKLKVLDDTSTTFQFADSQTFALEVGGDRALDGDSNNVNELSIKVKSINALAKQARVILTQLA